MNKFQLVEERVQRSSRVRHLLGQAIQTSVSLILDIDLSNEEARSLSSSGSIEEVVDRLEERMQVQRRGIKQRAIDPEVERKLGISEVVMELSGISQQERSQHIEKAIRKWERRLEEQEDAEQTAEEFEEMMDALKERGGRFRRFVGRIENLRHHQLRRLKFLITDRDRLPVAVEELNRVYEKYLKEAAKLLEKI